MKRKDRLRLGIYLLYFVYIVAVGATSFFVSNFLDFILSFLALILIFSPMVLQKKLSSTFPSLFDTLILIYLYLGTYLGDFKSLTGSGGGTF